MLWLYVLAKLRAGMDEIPKCGDFIKRFPRDAGIMSECQEILETQGLTQDIKSQSDAE